MCVCACCACWTAHNVMKGKCVACYWYSRLLFCEAVKIASSIIFFAIMKSVRHEQFLCNYRSLVDTITWQSYECTDGLGKSVLIRKIFRSSVCRQNFFQKMETLYLLVLLLLLITLHNYELCTGGSLGSNGSASHSY